VWPKKIPTLIHGKNQPHSSLPGDLNADTGIYRGIRRQSFRQKNLKHWATAPHGMLENLIRYMTEMPALLEAVMENILRKSAANQIRLRKAFDPQRF
jgi:hypothetical protein